MNILLAVPDRDLLSNLARILTLAGHTVTTAFDGLQAVGYAAGARPDAAVLDDTLPRVEPARLRAALREAGGALIVLSRRPLSVRLLGEASAANAYLPYPFSPDELLSAIERVTAEIAACRRITACGITADTGTFRLEDAAPLTDGELRLLEAAADGGAPPSAAARVCALSLNRKLARLGAPARISYKENEGYKVVTI